jgi:hypothetical protein
MRISQGGMTPARSAGLVAAGLVAGGILAATIGANAAGSGSSSSGTPTTVYAAGVPGDAGFAGGHGRSDEKVVTGANATTMTTKAKAKVPGGTVLRVESDAGDAAYEVHLQKSDGSLVTVKFDKNFNVTRVEDGMGKGDPTPPGGTAPSTSGSSA